MSLTTVASLTELEWTALGLVSLPARLDKLAPADAKPTDFEVGQIVVAGLSISLRVVVRRVVVEKIGRVNLGVLFVTRRAIETAKRIAEMNERRDADKEAAAAAGKCFLSAPGPMTEREVKEEADRVYREVWDEIVFGRDWHRLVRFSRRSVRPCEVGLL
jgi:hypothetical protein